MGAFRDLIGLVGECNACCCETWVSFAGGGIAGGTGGTGSLAAHTEGQISSHGTTSLCGRIGICHILHAQIRLVLRMSTNRDEIIAARLVSLEELHALPLTAGRRLPGQNAPASEPLVLSPHSPSISACLRQLRQQYVVPAG
jgi:hypothetical protein